MCRLTFVLFWIVLFRLLLRCLFFAQAVFLKLAGPELVQMYIGDGAKMIRDAFDLAREKAKTRGGAIIFIDEIDAIGGKRGGDEKSGGREVQRTMLGKYLFCC